MKTTFSTCRALLFLLFYSGHGFVFAQDIQYAPDIEKKIKEVENNLGLWVQIEGAKIDATLQDRMAFHKVNGVSIAVVKNYKIEWARGFGWADINTKQPVTTATLFQAGSISKSLNGVGVLKLVQEGKLDLSADINDYLKSWKFPYNELSKGKKISTANLLSHTAGLTIHGFPGYEVGKPLPTYAQILDGAKPANTSAVRSAFEPGLKFQYSGGGTTISQVMVEDITGQPYDVYMWENVLKPMGMLSSSYTQPPASGKPLATAHNNKGKAIKGNYHLYPEQAAAGLWTNPSDLARYIIETQLALEGKSSKVLSESMTKLRLTPFIDKSSALGVFVDQRGEQTYFQHGGVDEGFVAQYYGSIEGGNGVVVMANTATTSIIPEIINSVAKVYDWKGFYNPQRKKVVEVADALLNTYLGDYKLGDVRVSIKKEGKDIYVIQDGRKMKLYFNSDTDFFILEVPRGEFSFLKDSENKITGIQQTQGSDSFKLRKVL